jgi:hypothetical protein
MLTTDDYWSRSLAEQAFRLAPAGSQVRAEILQLLGSIHRMQGHGRLAWRLSQLAIKESAAVGRFDIQLAALNQRLAIERIWGLGRPKHSMRDIEHLVDTELNLPSAEWAWTAAAARDVGAELRVAHQLPTRVHGPAPPQASALRLRSSDGSLS